MKYLTPAETEELRAAIATRDAAQLVINRYRDMMGLKNHTHALRLALGQCQRCGGEKEHFAWYCAPCNEFRNNALKAKRNK